MKTNNFFKTLLLTSVLFLSGCDVIEIDIEENRHVLDADGGQFAIEVYSTGFDEVSFDFGKAEPWITVDTIEGFSADLVPSIAISYTRALLSGNDTITLRAEPNATGSRRSATLFISDLGVKDHIKIVQKAR